VSRLHKPRAGFWIRLCVLVVYPVDSLLFRIRWRELDRIPPPGRGVILVANHISYIDTLLMARLVWQSGRIPRFLVKNTVLDVPVLGRILHGARQIPVFRGTDDAAKSLQAATVALRHGESVLIYPEGTTTKDPAGWPMAGKTGVARLVLLAPEIPVVPIGQWGAQPPARRSAWLRRRRVAACVGEPLDLSRFAGQEPGAENLREITDLIMSAVREQVSIVRGEPAPTAFFRPTGGGRSR